MLVDQEGNQEQEAHDLKISGLGWANTKPKSWWWIKKARQARRRTEKLENKKSKKLRVGQEPASVHGGKKSEIHQTVFEK